jgi:LemA protein
MKIGGDILYIYIIIGIIVILLIYILITYNSFINSKNLVKEAFSTMDIYLKKRWDLIPNLIEVVKGYSKYENETLTKITSLRSSSYDELTMDNKININEDLSRCLSNIFAVSENYPELKANELYTNLSNNLISIEDEIANSRKYYNGTVRNFNNKIQMFPNNILAKLFRFKEFKMFEANAEEKNNVGMNLND